MKIHKAWLAGFIDGEGCLNFGRCRNSIFPRILITHTDKKILENIKNIYGGDIHTKQVKSNWKPSHYYRIAWNNSIKFLDDIYKYLILKRNQADLFYKWDKIRLGQGRTTKKEKDIYKKEIQKLIEEMHFLNKKGKE